MPRRPASSWALATGLPSERPKISPAPVGRRRQLRRPQSPGRPSAPRPAHRAPTPQQGPRICIGIWFNFPRGLPWPEWSARGHQNCQFCCAPGWVLRGRERGSTLKSSTPHLGTSTPPAIHLRSLKSIGCSGSFDFYSTNFPAYFSDLSFFLLWLEKGGKRERKEGNPDTILRSS